MFIIKYIIIFKEYSNIKYIIKYNKMSDLYKQAANAKVTAGQFDQTEISELTDEQVCTKVTGLIHATEVMANENADWYVPAGAYLGSVEETSGENQDEEETTPTAAEVQSAIDKYKGDDDKVDATDVEAAPETSDDPEVPTKAEITEAIEKYDLTGDDVIDEQDVQAASELQINTEEQEQGQEQNP